ncbi:hypothetical protein ACH45_07690 [Ligilactobacillus animalis]|nr:hypothetical protein ACH45_07690 [Ligilactobacillus animalis]THE21407.1 hypothetical protein ACH44_04260 [Ligilactobacillus animalis]
MAVQTIKNGSHGSATQKKINFRYILTHFQGDFGMDNVNSGKAVHVVSDVLEELKFKNYVVVIRDTKTEKDFDGVFNGNPEETAELLLEFMYKLPVPVKLCMSNYLANALASGKFLLGDDER